jgi:hypothetical protein
MRKIRATTVLKAAALLATLTAAGTLGLQLAAHAVHPATLIGTALAVLLCAYVLADDMTRTVRRALNPAFRFRRRHGDPATWDDDEYEAYFAITAHRTRPAA